MKFLSFDDIKYFAKIACLWFDFIKAHGQQVGMEQTLAKYFLSEAGTAAMLIHVWVYWWVHASIAPIDLALTATLLANLT